MQDIIYNWGAFLFFFILFYSFFNLSLPWEKGEIILFVWHDSQFNALPSKKCFTIFLKLKVSKSAIFYSSWLYYYRFHLLNIVWYVPRKLSDHWTFSLKTFWLYLALSKQFRYFIAKVFLIFPVLFDFLALLNMLSFSSEFLKSCTTD